MARSDADWVWSCSRRAAAGAGTVVGVRAGGTAAAGLGCRRAALAPVRDGTEVVERAAGTTAAAGRTKDRCSVYHRNHHRRNRCCGMTTEAPVPDTTVAGTAAVADSPRWARVVEVRGELLASDHRMLGSCRLETRSS